MEMPLAFQNRVLAHQVGVQAGSMCTLISMVLWSSPNWKLFTWPTWICR